MRSLTWIWWLVLLCALLVSLPLASGRPAEVDAERTFSSVSFGVSGIFQNYSDIETGANASEISIYLDIAENETLNAGSSEGLDIASTATDITICENATSDSPGVLKFVDLRIHRSEAVDAYISKRMSRDSIRPDTAAPAYANPVGESSTAEQSALPTSSSTKPDWFDKLSDRDMRRPLSDEITIAMGTGSVVVVASLTFPAPRERLLYALISFSRLTRGDLLKNHRRRSMYEYIRDHPGTHFSALRNALSLSNGSAMYHLTALERASLVTSHHVRGKRIFCVAGKSGSLEKTIKLSPVQEMILHYLASHPGSIERCLVSELGLKKARVSYNIRVLRGLGLLRVERRGRSLACFPKSDMWYLRESPNTSP